VSAEVLRQPAVGELTAIYAKLYEHFGPRGWWPAESDFEMIVGAILTQAVSWRNVERAIANLRQAGALTVPTMRGLPRAELEALIRPCGYYRAKAEKLRAFLQHLDRYHGDLAAFLAQPLAQLRPQLLGIYGVGPETADSILLYAARQPVFVVDAYTRRVFARLGFFSPRISYAAMQDFFHRHLPADVPLFNEYHALLDALANRLCRKRDPACRACPLGAVCPGGSGN